MLKEYTQDFLNSSQKLSQKLQEAQNTLNKE